MPPGVEPTKDDGSILIVVATNAPAGPNMLKAMAKRAAPGLGRNGSTANSMSGDFVIAFSTTKMPWPEKKPYVQTSACR